MRKTKIVCTIGPSSESPEMIEKLCLAGMDLQEGDNIVLTGGMINGTSGNTNLIKIATV